MGLFRRKISEDKEKKDYIFLPFHETFKWITFTLTAGLMFPNPATERSRLVSIALLFLATTPVMSLVWYDMLVCWLRRDIFNIIRHSTIAGPVLAVFLKMILMYVKRGQAKKLIDEMNSDYETYNSLSKENKKIAAACIKQTALYSEGIWSVLVAFCIMGFPFIAISSTLYSHLFESIPTKYMVHDVLIPFLKPEERFDSPYFEILFCYMVIIALMSLFNYTAYDAFFGLAANHACLKMTMFCKRLEDALNSVASEQYMWDEVVGFIEEQKKMYEYADIIQDSFNIWLGVIGISTMIQIGSLMYHISAGYGFDVRYTLFSFTAVIHVFLPCSYASKLKYMTEETATLIYCSGWERVQSRRIRRATSYLIARAQQPKRITAFYMFEYGMELFVSMMKTSYSMFTLLRS